MRILGLVLGIVCFYYIMAIREGVINLYRWSVYGRLILFPAFCIFALMGLAPPVIMLIGAIDSGCAIWTGLALRQESREEIG